MTQTKIVGLGGSLREPSRSRAALEVALDGAERAGATVELLDLHVLQLPMYSPELEAHAPPVVRQLIETCYEADGMLWSSPMYNGSVSGSFKNAIDWLHMLGTREPPYLHDEVIGLISAAGGTQGLQVVNTMEFSVRSLRGWAVPYVVPVPQAARVFAESGEVQDDTVEQQLRLLGEEVVRVAEQFARDPTLHRQVECDDAADRVGQA
ncbi:MAG: NADPH-dependent FMN reductase [Solirubrobacteraceae bacterium]